MRFLAGGNVKKVTKTWYFTSWELDVAGSCVQRQTCCKDLENAEG